MRMKTSHSKRVFSAIIALSMVVSMMSGLSFFTVSAAEAVSVTSWSELKTALESTGDVDITVANNIDFDVTDATTAISNCISVSAGTKTIDLNGKGVSFCVSSFELMEVSGVPKSLISVSGSASLTIKDSTGFGILNYIATTSDYETFTAPKLSGGLISVSGTATVKVDNAKLNNVAIGSCINAESGSPTIVLDGALLTTGASYNSWSGGFALQISDATTSPNVTMSNGSKMMCSSTNSIHSAYGAGGGAMYVGNYNANITINSAILAGTVQSRVASSSATKLPYVSVATHQIKVDKTIHTADADYLEGPNDYDVSVDSTDSTAENYFMYIADSTGNFQSITTEITVLSDVEEEVDTFDTVVGAFEGAYGTTENGFAYDFANDSANTNLVSANTTFKNKITPSVGSDESSITVTSDIAAKMEGFAQFYSDNRWTCASEMSFDIKMGSTGSNFAGFMIKYGKEIISGASKDSVFYSNDGVRGDSANSTTGTTGIGFSFRTIDGVACIEIFVKYLDADGNLCVYSNYFYNIVEDLTEFNTYRVSDDNAGTIKFYANDVLFATLICSDAKVPTATNAYAETYYSTVEFMNEKGAVIGTVSNALVSTQSAIAFATRNEIIEVDNIVIKDKTVADPKINGATIVLLNDITVRYIVVKDAIVSAGYENLKLHVDYGEQDYVITPTEGVSNNKEAYIFDFQNITPQKLKDDMHVVLYAELNNKVYASVPIQYSVSTYAYRQLEKSTNESFKTMLVDLLRYGAAAQMYTSYKTDDLVDAQLTAEQAAYGTQEVREFVSSLRVPSSDSGDVEYDVTWKGANLVFKNKVTLKVIFAVESTDGLCVKVTNSNGDLVANINENQFEAVTHSNGSSAHAVEFDNLIITELSDEFNFTVYNSIDNVVSGTLVYSAESYAYSKHSSSDTNLANLVKTMMLYGDAVKVYAANS